MKRAIGLMLLLVGLTLCAGSAFLAIQEIGSLYSGLLDDPLADPDVPEKERKDRILVRLIPGAVGVPVLLVGTVMLKTSRIKKRARRR